MSRQFLIEEQERTSELWNKISSASKKKLAYYLTHEDQEVRFIAKFVVRKKLGKTDEK